MSLLGTGMVRRSLQELERLANKSHYGQRLVVPTTSAIPTTRGRMSSMVRESASSCGTYEHGVVPADDGALDATTILRSPFLGHWTPLLG